MSAPKDGGPITSGMQTQTQGESSRVTAIGGLSKREYFAAMAMQGLLANPNYGAPDPTTDAFVAVREADALLAELGKEVAS